MPAKPDQPQVPEDTYFTCTLGQATLYNKDLDFKNIPTFLDYLASTQGDSPAVGLWTPRSDNDNDSNEAYTIYTFKQVIERADETARYIYSLCGKKTTTAALLVRSVEDFLFCFLGLIRLGRPALLLAPQLSGSAIAELCRQCDAELLHEVGAYDDLVNRAVDAAGAMEGFVLKKIGLSFPLQQGSTNPDNRNDEVKNLVVYSARPGDTAYLHHTSGTSSGTPKPIPQSHNAGCGVQPRLDGFSAATFTTTPLYHGGVADLFRAWTSGAMMWLFPGDKLPITAKNVSRCLEVAESASRKEKVAEVRYFSSVPYVLQGMAEHPRGLEQLQTMSIVGVGGAALPGEVGDKLVRQGVNLISRFGSAECGFLMSSHRDSSSDTEWQYLRPGTEGSKFLRFEQREEDGLCELVVLKGWPHLAKRNREDGSFATSDLFERHPRIEGAWRYHSRADSQLTLITGKKFDPAPLEAGIAASSKLLRDVLIFGNGRPYAGALLFRSEEGKNMGKNQLLEEVWKHVERFNREGQAHTRLSKGMLVVLDWKEEDLEKSSKGTVIRRKADERFENVIERAYGQAGDDDRHGHVPDEEILGEVRRIVKDIMGSETKDGKVLTDEADLFTYGADSVSCIQIRRKLAGLVGDHVAGQLPPTIVEDCGSIRVLSQTILDLRHGRQTTNGAGDDQIKLMQDLVETYSKLELADLSKPSTSISTPNGTSTGRTILLTGSTGSLGSHLLSKLLSESTTSHIHLLLRGSDLQSARSRLLSALDSRHIALPSDFDTRVSFHLYQLAEPLLGLDQEIYTELAKTVDVIYDLAWSVNFLLPLRGFKPHFASLQALLSLALAHATFSPDGKPAKVVFCSSTASVSSYASLPPPERVSDLTPESIITNPSAAGGIGYSRSKWVAENICHQAVQKHEKLRGHLSVVRVGQISGDTVHGVWLASEAYPLMLGSAKVTGVVPGLEGEKVGWTPVDVAARGFVELMGGDHREVDGVRVVHLLNPSSPVEWRDVVGWIKEEEKEGFEIVDTKTWLEKLEGLKGDEREEVRSHPSLKLLDFWRGAYGKSSVEGEAMNLNGEGPECEKADLGLDRLPQAEGFDISKSLEAMAGLTEAKAVDKEYVLKLWRWIKENI